MRRTGLLCVAAMTAALSAAGGGAATARAPQGETRQAAGEVAAPWALMAVSRDQRTLFARYQSGGCDYGGHGTVSETPTTVTIRVSQYTKSGQQVCPAYLGFPLVAVRLSAPVAGRHVQGNECPVLATPGCPPPGPIDVFRSGDVLREVPRLIGLSPPDARAALRRQGFRTRVRGRGPMVTAERPAPATALGAVDRRPVVLVLGRR